MATVVVKTSFSLAQNAPMPLIEPPPVRRKDEHVDGHPMRSLEGARELAPQLHHVDVYLTGTARPPQETSRCVVRMAMANERGPILDKSLVVVGDETDSGERAPFKTMKLGYERAFGGIGFADNPLGTGYGGATSKPANILDIEQSPDKAVNLGALPSTFPGRRRLLGKTKLADMHRDLVDIPESFDWTYYQCAPADQRIANLRGDEWVALDHLVTGHPQLRTRLPGGVATTRIYNHDAAGMPDRVPLRIDTVHFETDELRCSVVWRGSFPVFVEDKLEQIVVAAGFELPGEPMLWPEHLDDLPVEPFSSALDHVSTAEGVAPEISMSPRVAVPEHPLAGTATIDPEGFKREALPFGGIKGAPVQESVATSDAADDRPSGEEATDSRPGGGTAPPPKVTESNLGATFVMSSPSKGSVATPFEKRDPITAPPMPIDSPLEGTITMAGNEMPAAALPFPTSSSPGEAPSQDRKLPAVPGAPWSQPDSKPPRIVHPPQAQGTAALDEGLFDAARKNAAESKEEADAKAAAKAEAEAAAKAEAEAAAKAEADAAAKAEAEARRAEEEAEAEARRAQEEADERRREEAETFAREQEQARREEAQRAAEEMKRRQEQASTVRKNMYGGFKRKR